jgi:hypothetical protein
MWNQRIRGVLNAVKRHGILGYAWRLLHRIMQFIYKEQVSTVFRRDLANDIEILEAKIPLEIRVYQPKDKDLLFEFLTSYVRQDLIEKTLMQGLTPMLGIVNNEIIALSWFTTNPLYLESLNLTLDYGNKTGYIEGSRTDDRFKGKSIAPAIRTRICKYLRDIGMKQVFVAAGDDNIASQAVAKKCRFEPYESITMRRIFMLHNYRRHKLGSVG